MFVCLFVCLLSDINECNDNNGGCEDRCINTAGSYFCECTNPGLTLGPNRRDCDGRVEYRYRAPSVKDNKSGTPELRPPTVETSGPNSETI